MMAPGTPSGTLPAFADGDAMGGRTGGCQSCLSVLGSGVAAGSAMASRFGVPFGVGDGLVSASSDDVLPFSSSSSLPTSFVDDNPTSFKAAKTDAPRTVISVPPLLTHVLIAATPPLPSELK